MLEDPHAPRVRGAARLATLRERRRSGLFLAEGPRAVLEALSCRPEQVRDVYASTSALRAHPRIADAAGRAGVGVEESSERVIAALAGTVTPQGVIAVCRQAPARAADLLTPGRRLVAVADQVRDPGNAGTIIRVADAAGADAVVFTAGSVDPYNPKAVRASTGSLFHLPIAVGAGLDDILARCRSAGLHSLAADVKGDDLAQAQRDGLLGRATAWVFGNEAHGLADETLAQVDRVLRIPVYGRAESLNLATAAAVCLYQSAIALHSGH